MAATFLLFRSRNTQQCQHRSIGCCITTVAVFLVLNMNKVLIFFVSNFKSLDLYSSKQPALESNILPLTKRSKHLHNDTHNAPGRAPRIHYCAESRKNSHLLPFKSDSVAFSCSAPASKKIHFFFLSVSCWTCVSAWESSSWTPVVKRTDSSVETSDTTVRRKVKFALEIVSAEGKNVWISSFICSLRLKPVGKRLNGPITVVTRSSQTNRHT